MGRVLGASLRRLAPTMGIVLASAAAAAQVVPGSAEKDVTYATVEGVDLKLDVYYPQSWNGPAPSVVYVHGGGWTSGDKSSGTGLEFKDELLARGYVLAAIDYRLAPQYKWPAQIEDVKASIRFLRANAARFGIDPNRIGALGGSAGGHLVSMLGLADAAAGFDDSGGDREESSRVAAVADLFGPADLTAPFSSASGPDSVAYRVFGAASPSDPVLATASPVSYVTPDDPPFLILQGEDDTTVPPGQSVELYHRLLATGVPARLVMVANAGHEFTPVGGPISPTLAVLIRTAADFFDANLKEAPRVVRRHLRRTP
jgi:acetyl esterase/lipase